MAHTVSLVLLSSQLKRAGRRPNRCIHRKKEKRIVSSSPPDWLCVLVQWWPGQDVGWVVAGQARESHWSARFLPNAPGLLPKLQKVKLQGFRLVLTPNYHTELISVRAFDSVCGRILRLSSSSLNKHFSHHLRIGSRDSTQSCRSLSRR